MPDPEISASPTPQQKVVVVHAGARDAYQLALALEEAGLLQALVTDLFWPSNTRWTKLLPKKLVTLLNQRSAPNLPASRIHTLPFVGLRTLLADKLPRIPFSVRRTATRAADASLGRAAGKLATRTRTGLLSYSYTGFHAFSNYPGNGILFQAHPHPATVRRILLQELTDHPDCAGSLRKEWELALPDADFDHLVRETTMAHYFLAASSFTRDSLVEHGTSASAIRVIPYGVDLQRFHPEPSRRSTSKLNLLFVGRINQRKGVKYLLEALRLLNSPHVHLTICGRVVDSLDLFKPFASQIDIRPSVSATDLVAAYQAANLFVFPSVAEGFGQVLLESLASGLPILTTASTAAPDLIDDGVQGFILPPRRPDLIAERITWALENRPALTAMGHEARIRAEHFTWRRFRTEAAQAVTHFLNHP